MPSKLSDYEVLYTIGSGSYGKCLKVKRRHDNKVLVWKDMDYGTMTEGEKQQLVSEVNLLRELKHPHIVRYHDRIIDRSRCRLYIVMEYCAGGDLSSLITKHRRERKLVDEGFVKKILIQLILALQACHNQRNKSGSNSQRVLHRDLKPANVFLDQHKNVKLGDFGLARVLKHDTSFAKTFVGTPYYMSPEQMSKDHYNEKSDIWSLGCLVYELCSLVPPFTAANQKLLAVKIKGGQFRPIPSKYSEGLKKCVNSMLRQTPNSRPTLEELLELPMLKQVLEEHSGLCNKKSCDKQKVQFDTKSADDGSEKNSNGKRQHLLSTSSSSKSSANIDKPESSQTSSKSSSSSNKSLDDRWRELRSKEREVKRREMLIEERERMAEEKMRSAEMLIKEYKLLRNELSGDKYNRRDDYKLYGDKENFRNFRKPTTTDLYKPSGYQNYQVDSDLDHYRRKMNNLNLHDNNHQRYKPVSDLYKGSSDLYKPTTGLSGEVYKPRFRYHRDVGKTRQVLGMR